MGDCFRIGVNMTGSPSAAHPADLAGLCPGINENGAGVWADGRETQSPGARRWYRRPRDQCAPKGRFLNALFFRALRRGQRKRGGAPGTVIAYYILREGGVYAPRAMRGLPRTPRSRNVRRGGQRRASRSWNEKWNGSPGAPQLRLRPLPRPTADSNARTVLQVRRNGVLLSATKRPLTPMPMRKPAMRAEITAFHGA